MDATEYLHSLNRMCKAHQHCSDCPIWTCEEGCRVFNSDPGVLTDTIKTVEQWSKDHPPETKQARFLKEYPNARTDWENILSVCPHLIDQTVECPVQKRCMEECWVCRRKYWNQEVSE